MFKLNSKTALITGAASGIGEAITNALSAAGARVIVADLNRRDGERVAQACAANGQSAHFFSLDVTDERNCVGVADTVRNEYGPLDILINNAGIGHVGTIEATAGTELDRLYAVNVWGVFNVTKASLCRIHGCGDVRALNGKDGRWAWSSHRSSTLEHSPDSGGVYRVIPDARGIPDRQFNDS